MSTPDNSQENGSGKIEIIMLATLDFTCIIMYYPPSITEKKHVAHPSGFALFSKIVKNSFLQFTQKLSSSGKNHMIIKLLGL